MNDNKRVRRITIAVLTAVLLGSIILLAHFLKPIPELGLDRVLSGGLLLQRAG